jgi:hypothetical protein
MSQGFTVKVGGPCWQSSSPAASSPANLHGCGEAVLHVASRYLRPVAWKQLLHAHARCMR